MSVASHQSNQTKPVNNNGLLNKTILVNWIMILIPVISILLMTVFYYTENSGLFIGFMVGSFGSSVFITMIITTNQQKFIRQFRETIVQDKVQSLNSSILYEPRSYFYLKELMYSGLIETAPNVYEAENYFEQKRPNYKVEVAWAYAIKQTVRERGIRVPRQAASNEAIIHGLFYKFTLPGYFKTNIIVRKDKEKGLMKMFEENPSFLYQNFSHVRMDHEKFEREFEVYSQDSTEAKNILNEEFMNTMLYLKKHYRCKVQFSLIDNMIYVTLNTRRKYFKPGLILFKKSASIRKTEMDINNIFYLPEKLDGVIQTIIHQHS